DVRGSRNRPRHRPHQGGHGDADHRLAAGAARQRRERIPAAVVRADHARLLARRQYPHRPLARPAVPRVRRVAQRRAPPAPARPPPRQSSSAPPAPSPPPPPPPPPPSPPAARRRRSARQPSAIRRRRRRPRPCL